MTGSHTSHSANGGRPVAPYAYGSYPRRRQPEGQL